MSDKAVNQKSLPECTAIAEKLPRIASVMDHVGNSQEYWGPVLEASYVIDFLVSEVERWKKDYEELLLSHRE